MTNDLTLIYKSEVDYEGHFFIGHIAILLKGMDIKDLAESLPKELHLGKPEHLHAASDDTSWYKQDVLHIHQLVAPISSDYHPFENSILFMNDGRVDTTSHINRMFPKGTAILLVEYVHDDRV